MARTPILHDAAIVLNENVELCIVLRCDIAEMLSRRQPRLKSVASGMEAAPKYGIEFVLPAEGGG
jgi:hypothetical protein